MRTKYGSLGLAEAPGTNLALAPVALSTLRASASTSEPRATQKFHRPTQSGGDLGEAWAWAALSASGALALGLSFLR